METDLVEFVAGLQDCVVAHMHKVPLYTTHTRHGTIFRASPKFQGDVWRDWVMVDWGPSGKSPCKIYGFVDLSALPENSRISYGGIQRIHPAIYAIVESAQYVDDEEEETMSEFLTPIETEVGEISNKQVAKQTFYLAPVEAFVDPLVVIPDLGGAPNAYFIVKTREEWRQLFVKWLNASHEHDVIEVTDEEESSEEDDEDSSQEEENSGEEDEDSGEEEEDSGEEVENSGEEEEDSGDEDDDSGEE